MRSELGVDMSNFREVENGRYPISEHTFDI